jgi:CMD domain protein
MTQPLDSSVQPDVIDQMVGLAPDRPLHTLRHQRDKVAVATQGSYDAMFDAAVEGLSVTERLLVALHACILSHAGELAAHYRHRLLALKADAALLAIAESGVEAVVKTGAKSPAAVAAADPRLRAILVFTQTLITNPIEGDKPALMKLTHAGLTTPAIVALAQLIAFLSYQLRVVPGLKAMQALEQGEGVHGHPHAAAPSEPTRAPNGKRDMNQPIQIKGFTNAVLDWKAWLDVVNPATASAEQIAVLEESNVKAKVSDYYLLLVHQTRILHQRSIAFNAIMYAPGGLSRAERELGSLVTSRINGCVYCASVHAQRFEQLAKRNDVVEQVFEEPQTAGTTAREKAIVQASIALTQAPEAFRAADIRALKEAGLSQIEILDLIHSVALFAWANRLMLNLGEPVVTETVVS